MKSKPNRNHTGTVNIEILSVLFFHPKSPCHTLNLFFFFKITNVSLAIITLPAGYIQSIDFHVDCFECDPKTVINRSICYMLSCAVVLINYYITLPSTPLADRYFKACGRMSKKEKHMSKSVESAPEYRTIIVVKKRRYDTIHRQIKLMGVECLYFTEIHQHFETKVIFEFISIIDCQYQISFRVFCLAHCKEELSK